MIYVESAIREIGNFFADSELMRKITIVEKSTVMAGTSRHLFKVLESNQRKFKDNNDKFKILSNPKFMAEGVAVRDIMKPDRVIIGGEYATNKDAMRQMEI